MSKGSLNKHQKRTSLPPSRGARRKPEKVRWTFSPPSGCASFPRTPGRNDRMGVNSIKGLCHYTPTPTLPPQGGGRFNQRFPNSHLGFTLVEVLVALAVLAIALAAIMRTMAQSIDTTAALREHDVALWVAQNRLAEHKIRQDWPGADTTNGEAEMGGQKWFWREQVSTTPEPKIRRIEITTRRIADSKESSAKLVGYLLNTQ